MAGMMNWPVILLVFIGLTVISAGLAQYGLRLLYNYRISDDCVQVVLFNLVPLRRVPFSNIAEIKKVTRGEVSWNPFSVELWGNRLFGQVVLIRKKRGLVRAMLITPDNADSFVQDTEAHLTKTE
jgi:hypothetical protein